MVVYSREEKRRVRRQTYVVRRVSTEFETDLEGLINGIFVLLGVEVLHMRMVLPST